MAVKHRTFIVDRSGAISSEVVAGIGFACPRCKALWKAEPVPGVRDAKQAVCPNKRCGVTVIEAKVWYRDGSARREYAAKKHVGAWDEIQESEKVGV